MEAILFMGVQGSGKTTYFRDHFLHTHVRLSLDLLRTRHRLDRFLQTCLHTQQRFVIDNTNVFRRERALYIAAARARRFAVHGYYFDVTLSDALRRNALRTGRHLIPERGIAGTFKRLEPPTPEEGFDTLTIVELTPEMQWRTRPWAAAP